MSSLRIRWLALVLAAVVGSLLCVLCADQVGRAVVSYLGGLAVATTLFELSTFNIRYTERHLPTLTFAAAMFSYVMTALALAVLLAACSPRVVNAAAIASGLVAAVLIWVSSEVRRLMFRSGPIRSRAS